MLTIFRPRTVVPDIDFSVLGTDVHSHLIPGIDDGAATVSQSVALVKSLIDLGFNKIITTPHVMMDYYRNSPETIKTGLDILKEELNRQNLEIDIDAAAEYYLDEDFENKLEAGDLLCIYNNHLLFELPFSNYPLNLFDIVYKLQDKGYTPVLAHPERYTYMHGSIINYNRLKDAGCAFQLNTVSLTGYYGKAVQRIAEELVDKMLIDFIGSDMHHLRHGDALRAALKLPHVYKLLTDYPLQNQII
jgi:protein-tyrosine phosphatase